MGKRSAVVELFLGDMGSIQRELRPSIQREDQLTMETKLEQIAVKARREPNLRFPQRHAGKRGRNRPETIYFLGLTLYCTRNRKGNVKVGMRTEKSRLRRSLTSLQELMQRIRHQTISEQVSEINAVLRGHYAYYGVAGNLRSLVKVYRVVERYWRKMLCSRSWAGRRLTWDAFHQIKERTPLLKPKLRLPYGKLQVLAVL